MAEQKDKVVTEAPKAAAKGGRVRLRNCDYPLTGSINIDKQKPIKYVLHPNVWTEVPAEVYDILKRKFGEVRYTDVPSALPDSRGEYSMAPGATRHEQQVQYVIEFA